jgi:hypothetical protein
MVIRGLLLLIATATLGATACGTVAAPTPDGRETITNPLLARRFDGGRHGRSTLPGW